MADKLNILMVGKEGKGGMVSHPAQFGYPEKKKIAERWFFNTGRFRVISGETVAVFTEEGFNLNLDDFADPYVEPPKIDTPTGNGIDVLAELEDIMSPYADRDSYAFDGEVLGDKITDLIGRLKGAQ